MDAPSAPPATAALDIQAALLGQRDLVRAAHACARAIAERCGYDRVSVGLAHGTRLELLGRSDATGTPAAATDTPLAAALTAALAESYDQRASLLLPEPAEPAQPRITLAHRRLLEARPGASVASVPLVAQGSLIGALCAERHGGAPITPAELAALESQACLAGPVLDLMRRNERAWHQRTADTLRAALRGGRLRLAALALGALAGVLLWMPAELRIGGHARLEGAVQRALVAPADGFLQRIHARPGDTVRAGQTLVELADQDLRLEQQRWQTQLAQHEGAYAAANARADRTQLVINQSRAAEALAQLELVDTKLERGRLDAPFDGIVVQGDLSQQLGAPVQQGAELMTIAPLDRYRVIVEVDERDIAYLHAGQAGSLVLSALPWRTLPLRVTRVAPVAAALDGRNVYEVEAELQERVPELRPGLLGSARIEAGSGSLGWIASRRLIEALRLTAWELFG